MFSSQESANEVGPIVLIGPMGSGKSTLGKRVAKRLGVRFIDTDKEFSKRHGAITNFFQRNGEERFRELETEVLEEVLQDAEDGAVVATGGGIVLRPENRALLHGHLVVFLDTTAEQVSNRISTAKRPLLQGDPEAWTKIYLQRLPLYQQVAKETLITAGKPISGTVDELLKIIERWRR